MEFKGTKGDWKAVEYSTETKIGYSTHEIQFGTDGECIAEVVHGEENAKLIAAAPDLLKALIDVTNELLQAVECINGIESAKVNNNILKADKAINKALK